MNLLHLGRGSGRDKEKIEQAAIYLAIKVDLELSCIPQSSIFISPWFTNRWDAFPWALNFEWHRYFHKITWSFFFLFYFFHFPLNDDSLNYHCCHRANLCHFFLRFHVKNITFYYLRTTQKIDDSYIKCAFSCNRWSIVVDYKFDIGLCVFQVLKLKKKKKKLSFEYLKIVVYNSRYTWSVTQR